MADLTSQHHGDRWLADLLRGASAAHFPQAVAALARAVQANDVGDYGVSHDQALLAEQLFRASGNMAGVLRSHFEGIFAAQIERQSQACQREAIAALAQSERFSYSWLQIQLGLETGVCSALMGDVGTDEKSATDALALAQKEHYGMLYLRAALFASENKLAIGDRADASAIAGMGLERYWSGQFPVVRGYSLYTGLATTAAASNRPNLEVAIWREAVGLIDSDQDLLQRAMAHSAMGDAATAARLPQVAEQQYTEASRLFSASPRTEASRIDALETDILAARVEARQNAFDAALSHLTRVQGEVWQLSNNALAQIFYSTLAEVQLRGHHAAEAERDFRRALALAEQGLSSIRTEGERLNWSKNSANVYLGLAEAQLVQGRSREALETYEQYLGAPQRVSKAPQDPQSLARPIRINPALANAALISPAPANRTTPNPSRLPPLSQETTLAYAALPDGLAIWLYDERGLESRWIPQSTDSLQELAERFRNLSSDPKSELNALRRDARSLYAALIAPVESQLAPGRTLVIEAEGWLAAVPFEALLDSNDHYLVERESIVHSLGQDSQARLRSGTGISADSLALVIASTASSVNGLIPLPDVAAEADTVSRNFHSSRVVKGGEATLSSVRSALPHAAVLHFAGHSVTTPTRTGLMLESGAGQAHTPVLLDDAVLRQLNLENLRLAVLSACSTASGSGSSSGINNVTDSFLRAGVPHVVASRWAVDSVATSAFVEDFYHNALSGQPISHALQQTAQKILANPRTSHPYYWSAFAAYGRP